MGKKKQKKTSKKTSNKTSKKVEDVPLDETLEEGQEKVALKKKKVVRNGSSKRAGIVFPVTRVKKHIAKLHKDRVGKSAGIYLAAVLEYLAAEVLEQAGEAAIAYNKKRITPIFIQKAIRMDREIQVVCNNCEIVGGSWQIPELELMQAHQKGGKNIDYKDATLNQERAALVGERTETLKLLQEKEEKLRKKLIAFDQTK